MSGNRASGRDDVVVRKAERGWVVGEENVSDLTSAMVLADLFAADHADGEDPELRPAGSDAVATPAPGTSVSIPEQASAAAPPLSIADEKAEAERLAVTVTQLEHALASRVRVEQAIGVLAERHRLRPREAFDLLRKASRSRGRRITDLAHDVVESSANPLLRLPDELARKVPEPRQRGRSPRRGRHALLSPGGTAFPHGGLPPPIPPGFPHGGLPPPIPPGPRTPRENPRGDPSAQEFQLLVEDLGDFFPGGRKACYTHAKLPSKKYLPRSSS
jgi:hypothetical protein